MAPLFLSYEWLELLYGQLTLFLIWIVPTPGGCWAGPCRDTCISLACGHCVVPDGLLYHPVALQDAGQFGHSLVVLLRRGVAEAEAGGVPA